ANGYVAGSGSGRGEPYGVAVLEEDALGSVGQLDGLLAVPAELDEAAVLLLVGSGDRTGGEQVAGTQRSAVDRRVRELLRRRPVHPVDRRPRDHLAVELDLDGDVEAPGLVAAQVGQRYGILGR